jgi:hypothetical protein
MKSEFIGLVAAAGYDGVVGAYHGAHGATNAFVSRIGFLPNSKVEFEITGRWTADIETDRRFEDSFAENPQFNSTYRTYGGTLSTQRAFILTPQDLPRQILYTEGAGGNGSV